MYVRVCVCVCVCACGVLHRLTELDAQISKDLESYDFHHIFTHLYTFCVNDLSAFYFDIRKDSLYCNALNDPKRLATQTVLHHVFINLCKWLAPILTFTIEEAWGTYCPSDSVFLHTFDVLPPEWHMPHIGARYKVLRNIRRVITGAIEEKRTAGHIKSSLQAEAIVVTTDLEMADLLNNIDLADFCITSATQVKVDTIPASAYSLEDVENLGVIIQEAKGGKCTRCWKILPEVITTDTNDPSCLCYRCRKAVEEPTL